MFDALFGRAGLLSQLALAQDGLDPCDVPPGFGELAGVLEFFGHGLRANFEQAAFKVFQLIDQFVWIHFSQFGGFHLINPQFL